MKYLAPAFAVTAALVSYTAHSEEAASKQSKLKCEIGPLATTYGATNWLVYSCDDHQTVVIVAAPDNPAMPFYFMFSKRENGYQLSGEGTGRRETTNAAFAELKRLSEADIVAIIERTKAH